MIRKDITVEQRPFHSWSSGKCSASTDIMFFLLISNRAKNKFLLGTIIPRDIKSLSWI